jgi:peptidoglycan biosynthesis protein MviN/MurJ (putative lipid II flippase)
LLRAGRTLYWYAQGREQFTNWVTGVVLVTQIVLSLWLIPSNGATGAAIVSLITETASFVLLWWQLKK